MKLTIIDIRRYNNKQDGTPLVTKNGNNYQSVMIVPKEEVLGTVGNKIYINDFSEETKDWEVGTVIDIEVVKKVVGDKTYINGNLPKKNVSRADFDLLVTRVKALEDIMIRDEQDEIPIVDEEES
jgi:hypothetical protein